MIEDSTSLAEGSGERYRRRVINGALDLYRLIMDSPLPKAPKFVALAIARHADSSTWCWPANPTSKRLRDFGVSVATLADMASYSERHARRALRALQTAKLLVIHDRGYRTNGYELLIDAWLDFAETFDAEWRARQDAEEEDRQRKGREARRAAGFSVPTPSPEDSPSAPHETADAPLAPPSAPAPAEALGPIPRWASTAARREGQDPRALLSLVGGLASLVLDQVNAAELGGVARPAVRLWRLLNYPGIRELVEDVRVVLEATRHAPGRQWQRIRTFPKWGESELGDLRVILRSSTFAERLRAARRWAEEAERGPGGAPGVRRLGASPPTGRVPWGPDQVEARWVDAGAALAERLGRDNFAIWLEPVQVDRLDEDGVLWLDVPNHYYADWIGDNFAETLVDVVGGPVGLVWRP